MNFGKTKSGFFYPKKKGISSSLPPTNTLGIPMEEKTSNNPLDFKNDQMKKLENQRTKDMQKKMELDKQKMELEENKTELEKLAEMIDESPVQESIQSSETSPQDVNLTDVPSSDRISEQENKKIKSLTNAENLTELSGKIIDKFGEHANEVLEEIKTDEITLEKDEDSLEESIKKGDKEEVKVKQKNVEADEKKLDKDKKDAKDTAKEEKKAESQVQKVVEKSVSDLINKSDNAITTGKGSGRHKFTEEDRKNFQSPSFRESLLDFEGGADALADAKAQGIF